MYYSAIKKEILPFETWMDLEGIIISEITQIQKDKNCMVPCTCEILKKKKEVKLVAINYFVFYVFQLGNCLVI